MLIDFDSTILSGLPVCVIARIDRGSRGWSSSRSLPPETADAEIIDICWIPRGRSRRTPRPVTAAVLDRIPDSDFERLETEAIAQALGA